MYYTEPDSTNWGLFAGGSVFVRKQLEGEGLFKGRLSQMKGLNQCCRRGVEPL